MSLSLEKVTIGQKSLHCPGTKGQQDKLKILPQNGPGAQDGNLTFCHGTGREGILIVCPIRSRNIPGQPWDRREKRVFFFFFFWTIFAFFAFFSFFTIRQWLCPGTEEFVPGFLLLLLSRDKWTLGQGNFFVPVQRDSGRRKLFCSKTKGQ